MNLKPMIATLLEAARWAPSGDNTQPWNFGPSADGSTIELLVDDDRDKSPMNAAQRMARIAIGAAVENLIRTAARNGWRAGVCKPVDQSKVVLQISGNPDDCGVIDPAVLRRCSNRRLYDGRALPKELAAQLRDDLDRKAEGKAICIAGRQTIEQIADVIGEADALMFASQSVRSAFYEKIKFKLPLRTSAEEGLSLDSLELSLADRIGLRLLPRLSERSFAWTGASRALRNKARRLAQSSSGLFVFLRNGGIEEDYELGRRLQAAWLKLTELGLSAQPMMSLPVLDNLRENDNEHRQKPGFSDAVHELEDRFLSAMNPPKRSAVGAILRFGYAAVPTARVGRRSIYDSIVRDRTSRTGAVTVTENPSNAGSVATVALCQ